MVFKFLNRKFKGVWWMPRLEIAMKDVAWRRYAPGRCLATFDPEMSEWGNPMCLHIVLSVSEGRKPGEVKHFSTRRKKD